ncbi:MAG TPA: PilZ domain-containing protein [Acidobacteriaceae bacterium]|jgi:c-di-GMP-binding flagellar brake protein YcgR|nr:PilZ domain-containing protein [Acidobacteriaceae bacterium]
MAADEARVDQSAPWTGGAERRAYPRHAVDCAALLCSVSGSAQIHGRLSDLSLGGCLVVADQRYTAGILVRIEVQFQLHGISFRIVGVTVGSREAKIFAVRFLDMPERRRRELAEVLEEVAAANAAAASAQQAPEAMSGATPNVLPAAVPPARPDRAMKLGPALVEIPKAAPPAEPEPAAPSVEPAASAGASIPEEEKKVPSRTPPKPPERRAQSRHAVDTRAKLLLVKTAISMPGRIVNLSLGGCRIRTDERFNVGIYVRIEAEFYLHGLPFRVGGVSQAILDKNTIGVRFLDMSDRRRDQLVELIAEIDEATALGLLPGNPGAGDQPETPPAAG